MQNAQRKMDKFGKNLKRTGANLSIGLTAPLVGIGTLAVNTFSELEGVSAAFNRLDNAGLLNNLRQATKGTVADLELMQAAVKAENFNIPLTELSTLLEFARRRAKDTGESVDFLVNSIVTGIGRKSPLILDNLGISASALKDQLNGASAASSSIASVTKAVGTIARQELKKMGADTFTLKEGFGQIKASAQNALAEVGGILAQSLKPAIEFIKNLISRFQELSPTTKKWLVILGGIAAAIGPLLALAGTILPAIISGFTILTGPIGLVAAALTGIGVIIYKNWKPIKKTLLDIANYFVDLYNESIVFRAAVESVIGVFKTLFEIGKFIFETLKNIIGNFIDQFVNGFKTVGKIIKAVFTGNLGDIPDIIKESGKESINNFKGFTSELANDWKNLTDGIENNAKQAFENITSRKKLTYFEEDVDASAVTDVVAKAAQKGLSNTTVTPGTGTGISFEDQIEIDDINDQIAELEEIDELLASTGDNFRKAVENADASIFTESAANQYEQFLNETDEFLVNYEEKMARMREIGNAVGDAVGGAFEDLSGRVVESLGLANTGFQGFIKGLVQTVTKLISIMLAQSISQSIAGATASGTATGPAAIFTTPGFIATAVSGVLAAFAAIPKFATGGIVGGNSFYGDKILARLNSGELVLNQSQQRNLSGMLDSPNVEPVILGTTTKLSGEDILIITERAQKKLNRKG